MRIAWAKFGGAITYGGDDMLGTAGGVNMNSRYIRELITMGHDVFPIVPLTRKSEAWPGREEGTIDEADLVIIENGPNSLLPSFDKVPAIAYLLNKLKDYSGEVIYLQTDPDLPFTFFPEHFTAEHYPGPDSDELQAEFKRWHVVTSCRNLEEFIAVNSGPRYQYQNTPSNVRYHVMELHDILADFTIPEIDTRGAENATGCYIGGERRLCKKLIAYSHAYPLDLFGKWRSESLSRLGPLFEYRGVAPTGEVYELYNQYQHSLIIGSPKYERVGMVAARLWETAFSGCLPLLDDALIDPTGGDIPRISVNSVEETLDDLLMMDADVIRHEAWKVKRALLKRVTTLGPVMERVLATIRQ